MEALGRQAIMNDLPTLEQLDREMCFLPREMFSDIRLSDEDLFIRDAKKGTYQRLVYAKP